MHIIGLTEVKEKSKKLIQRPSSENRYQGSLLENIIYHLETYNKLSNLTNLDKFGTKYEEQIFGVALELVITWVNRILFLKLLEAQLINYNDNDKNFAFLHGEKIANFNDLDTLFFQVLAKRNEERTPNIQAKFAYIPYLNSSLFEVTELENKTLLIANLNNDYQLPLFKNTVLKDNQGNKKTGELNTLTYLFEFLSAYNFSSEGTEEIQEEKKNLINASVLGLIFEKINGYQDGSFFTPGFITMYMCRETITRAVIEKFNQAKNWNCANIEQLQELIEYQNPEARNEANHIINSIKICDPAVGSGHFLVSALNEIIALKSKLNILQDREGKRIKEYTIGVENDELIIKDEDGDLYSYKPNFSVSQRIQETLFHEKKTIIENCLFGVDININSVKICRLRLWIELLKNAYYHPPKSFLEKGTYKTLETLPNIDINIKCGNSLISHFDLNSDLTLALKKHHLTIEDYQQAIKIYHNPESRQQKQEIERLINQIKENFSTAMTGNDPLQQQLRKKESELYNLQNQTSLFAESAKEIKAREKKEKSLQKEIDKLTQELEDKQNNVIYSNAFEWRFEFPEVLNESGDFIGFDLIIGNPPYIRQETFRELKPTLSQEYECYTGMADLYVYFYEKGLRLLKKNSYLSYISSNKYLRAGYGEKIRSYLAKLTTIEVLIDFGDANVFDVTAYPSIILFKKQNNDNDNQQIKVLNWRNEHSLNNFNLVYQQESFYLAQSYLNSDGWRLESTEILNLLDKLKKVGIPLGEYVNDQFYYGIKTGFNEAFIINQETRDKLINEHPSSAEVLKPLIRGRDVKRWCINFAQQYLIKIESSENKKHPWSDKPEKEAENIFAQTYPAIYNRFNQYRDSLIRRTDQGKYFWELRSCTYYNEFETAKIIYPNICNKSEFTFDENSYLTNQKAFIIPTKSKYLLGILNSNIVTWLLGKLLARLQSGFYEPSTIFMKNLPIPKAEEKEKKKIEKLVQKCLDAKGVNVKNYEDKINEIVAKLYGLEEEIKIIEGHQ